MPFTKSDLLVVLNRDEPVWKKVKIADSAFKSSELSLPHKEALLLKWILKLSDHDNKAWETFINWINSDQFKELTRNDINNEEITNIIELLKNKLIGRKVDDHNKRMIFSSVLALTENIVFQQYFKYNIETFCTFVSCILDNICCSKYLETFLEKDVFFKSVVAEEKFHKHFLDTILPVLAQCLLKFNISRSLFQGASKIIQKCVFYKYHTSFKIFINQFFEENKTAKQVLPKALFKNLLDFYKEDVDKAKIQYKLVFHAFCCAYDLDFELSYKFFILLIHIIGFNLEKKGILYKTKKLEITETNLSQNKSQEIILELINVLSETKNNLDYKVNEITFSNFIGNILKQLLYFNSPSGICYKIFVQAIIVDPTVIEPITDDIIEYAMMVDNHKQMEEYETLIIAIFEVFSKLHRIESLVAKLVRTLSVGSLVKTKFEEVYEFKGTRDAEVLVTKAENIKVDNILTKKIKEYFCVCICSLASWQIINIFKTLLYYLHNTLNYVANAQNEDVKHFIFMEILSVLICTLLSSIRIAEHTVTNNVVVKSVKELEELRSLLKHFGMMLLKREHNHVLMRSFLNIAYNWAEIYLTLSYYSINSEVQLKKVLDNDCTSCNITYLHPYLNVKQWCLISERITNFGELPCKQLLNKLYIQKLRAMLLFEKNINNDIITNVIRSIVADLGNHWEDILQDKYVVHHLLPKMDSSSIIFLAESLVNDVEKFQNVHRHPHISDSFLLLTAVNYITIIKINKLLLKHKRKLNEDVFRTAFSSKICSLLTEYIFLSKEDHEETVKKAKQIFHSSESKEKTSKWKINEEKIVNLFEILHKFPVIYSSETAQKMYLLYFSCLHKDLSFEFGQGNYNKLQVECEKVIIGVLQYSKFKHLDVFQIETFCKEIVENYSEGEFLFSLITENTFKSENTIKKYGSVISEFTGNISIPKYLRCCVIIINAVGKLKKTKMSKDVKIMAEKYKAVICDEILELVSKNKPEANLVNSYAQALRHFLSHNDPEKLRKLLNCLNLYIEFALKDTENCESYLTLFITLLQQRSKIELTDEDFIYKVWSFYTKNESINSKFEEYSQLVVLIHELIPIEMFSTVTTDLLSITDNFINMKNFVLLVKYLKTWESVFSCNLNPTKTKILHTALERLLEKLIFLLQDSIYDADLFESIFNLEKTVIQTTHLLLTPSVIDTLILSVSLLMSKQDQDYQNIFNLSISILEYLLKYRKPVIMDRLPPYLQQYRLILKSLCQKSNSDLNLGDAVMRQVSNCAHQLEKLTKNLIMCQKDMGRIAMYLIADVLEQYEQITLYPNVKIHLNNCIYSLITVCDQHAVTYLMRVLSSASTEMFKIIYENYKKYYRFMGKI